MIDIFAICIPVCTSNPMRLYFFIFVGCATPTGRCLPAYRYWNRRACRTHGFLADGLRSEIGDTKAINLLKMLGSLHDLYWHRSKVSFGWYTCSSVCYVICIRFPTIPVFVLQRLNLWPLECLVWKQLHSHHIRKLLWRCIVEHLWDKVDTTGVWCATRHLSLFTILKVQEVQPQKSKILGRDMFLEADRLSGRMLLLLKQEYMGVSKPRGTLKWMVLENPYLGVPLPISGKTPMYLLFHFGFIKPFDR